MTNLDWRLPHLALLAEDRPRRPKYKRLVKMADSEAVQEKNGVRVSLEDADLLKERVWHIRPNGYAAVYIKCNRTLLVLHRVIMARILNRPILTSELCDHIDGNKINNRRDNLRLTTYVGSSQNRFHNSPFRGTTWHKHIGKWQASARFNGKTYYLGLFDDRTDAAKAAADKRKELGFLSPAP